MNLQPAGININWIPRTVLAVTRKAEETDENHIMKGDAAGI
jgi:hypothetical protein